MDERYTQAVRWAEHYLSTAQDSEMQIREGVYCHSLHTKINTCKSRIEHSKKYAQYIAYRSIKEIKDLLVKIN